MKLSDNFNSVETLEKSITLPQEITGEDFILRSEGDMEILYRGVATKLHFDGLNIYGNARLQKIQRTKKVVKKQIKRVNGQKKVLGIFSKDVYGYETIEEQVVDETLLWEIWADDNCSHKVFIYSGEICTYDTSYWGGLVSNATKQGIILANQIRQAVFGKIDQQLLGLYKQVKEFSMKP